MRAVRPALDSTCARRCGYWQIQWVRRVRRVRRVCRACRVTTGATGATGKGDVVIVFFPTLFASCPWLSPRCVPSCVDVCGGTTLRPGGGSPKAKLHQSHRHRVRVQGVCLPHALCKPRLSLLPTASLSAPDPTGSLAAAAVMVLLLWLCLTLLPLLPKETGRGNCPSILPPPPPPCARLS